MMNDFIVKVEKTTRMVDLPKNVIGNDMENLQEKLIFKFTDEFVNGQGRLEYKIGSTKNYIVLSKENDTYTIPVQNVITKEGKIKMQLVITEGTDEENILVFKSNVFWLYCNKSINAVNEAPEGYTLWIETANAKLNEIDEALQEVDNLNIDANKIDTTTTIEITKKDGTTESVQILDGQNGQDGITPTIGQNGNWFLGETDTGKPSRGIQGEKGQDGENGTDGHDGVDGQDAKINGVNTLTIEAGSNINLEQEGNTLTISSTGGGSGGTTNYQDLTNKPSINNVTLTGNKSLNDLGIQAAGNYITNEADPTVPSYVKNITQSNINSWNNKSNFSGNYNDLTNKPTIPAEVTENTVSGWGFTKNTGTYSKPVAGIPKTDLESAVQTSLGKADTALQSYTEQYTGTITGITMNGVSKGTSGVVDLGTVITSHQDISGKLDTSKVKSSNSTTAGDVYDVTYINSMIGNIEALLGGI